MSTQIAKAAPGNLSEQNEKQENVEIIELDKDEEMKDEQPADAADDSAKSPTTDAK